MLNFDSWSTLSVDQQVGSHYLQVRSALPNAQPTAATFLAAALPSHYAGEARIAQILRSLGKPAAAKFIEDKLPTIKTIRSGDLGEILATEWVNEKSNYLMPIKRLRWKDHRNMAMRGEDAIGFYLDPNTQKMAYLKVEAKSRAALNNRTLEEARRGLDQYNGLPSSHAVAFIADRLANTAEDGLSMSITKALYGDGVFSAQVKHLTFTFSGNNPHNLLANTIASYTGAISQIAHGLYIVNHGVFVAGVYELVIANAKP